LVAKFFLRRAYKVDFKICDPCLDPELNKKTKKKKETFKNNLEWLITLLDGNKGLLK
jgi:hypothetical protein